MSHILKTNFLISKFLANKHLCGTFRRKCPTINQLLYFSVYVNFSLQLEAALLDDCTVNDIYAICQGKKTFPDTLRADLWMCCLVTQKSDALSHFDEIYDLPFQKQLRQDCQNFVDTLGNDELEQVGVISDLESILTFYCKNRNLKYESRNGWIETLLPILSLKLKRSDTYNLFEAIRDTYIPKDNVKDKGNVYHVFRLLILYHDPELCAVLDTCKITPEMYAMSWFQSLFASTCQLSVVLLIWDLYFQQSDPFLVFFLSLIMLVNRRDEVIGMRREDKASIVKFLSNMPCELESDDVIDFCSLAQYYSTRTPASFKSEMLNQLFGTQTNIDELVKVSQALCLPVSVYELIENSSDAKADGAVRFFLVDCRPVDQYNCGHLATAFHLDYNLMLTEPTSFQTAMQGLQKAQKGAIDANASGEHLVFLGSGRIEEDQYTHMVVASFLQKGTQFVSILSGGYFAIHDYFGENMLDCLEDHDVHRCLVCAGGAQGLAIKNRKSQPSTSSQIQQPPKSQFDLFSKFSSAMKSKTSDVKSKFFDILANPASSNSQAKQEEIVEKHVSMSEKNGKRYRNLAPVFGLDEDEPDMGADFAEEEANNKELINIQEYLKKTSDIVQTFKCQEVQINGAMYESYLVLTTQRIEVIRELENGMGKIHVKRPLTQIVKITAKKRHRDLITFKYIYEFF